MWQCSGAWVLKFSVQPNKRISRTLHHIRYHIRYLFTNTISHTISYLVQKTVCLFKLPSIFFPAFVRHVGLKKLQKLNGQLAQLYQTWCCEPKAPGLCRTNKGIYMVHLKPQHIWFRVDTLQSSAQMQSIRYRIRYSIRYRIRYLCRLLLTSGLIRSRSRKGRLSIKTFTLSPVKCFTSGSMYIAKKCAA